MAGKGTATALVAAFAMIAAERASAHDEPIAVTDQSEATIVLHVVNSAALSRDILNRARNRVVKVYENIGVRIVWVDSAQPVRKHFDGGLHLSVMLLPHDIAERKIAVEGLSNALGQAHFASGRAYIFGDRIVAMPRTTDFPILLGSVIAHEVGHLVLPEKSHSRNGVMRADVKAQQAMYLQSFDKTQARAIHAALTEPSGQR